MLTGMEISRIKSKKRALKCVHKFKKGLNCDQSVQFSHISHCIFSPSYYEPYAPSYYEPYAPSY